jgi:uncharacterized membrane protein
MRWLRFVLTPPEEADANVRRHLWIEVVLFAALLAFAAAMARGYGQFWIEYPGNRIHV